MISIASALLRRPRAALLASACSALLYSIASTADVAARDLPQYDALANAPRTARPAASASDRVDQRRDARVARAHYDERLGVPTLLWLQPGATASKSGAKLAPATAAREGLKRVADLYGLSAAEVDAAPLQHVQALGNGAQLVKFTNRADGVDVFREQAGVLLGADGEVRVIGGYLAGTGHRMPAAKAAFSLSAEQAIAIALGDYGFAPTAAAQLAQQAGHADAGAGYRRYALADGVTGSNGARLDAPARAKQVWFRLPDGLVPGWYVELEVVENDGGSAYGYVIAADDGRLLFRNDHESHATAYAYRAFAEDSVTGTPLPGPHGRSASPHPTGLPDGFQGPFVAPTLRARVAGPISTNDPWLPDGETRTIGNNVEAWANLFGTGNQDGTFDGSAEECDPVLVTGDFHACTSSADTFDYTYDTALQPQSSKAQIVASVVNLFYVTNWLHDDFYDAGFDEAAGNAQADNYTRGGVGGDSMRAQAQDYSGVNNANMQTPADGGRPRMRMYVFEGEASARGTVLAPAPLAGEKTVTVSFTFGPQNFDVTGALALAQDGAGASATDGCEALTNAATIAGNIALIDRGNCDFNLKVANAQAAGATGVVIANNQPAHGNMGGTNPAVTIPVLMVSQADGAAIKAEPDGTVTMQLERLTNVDRDGTLDNAIIAHEWGHYISNRLVGNANGLTTNQSRGLGEGWGDFHSMLMTVKEEDALVAANANFAGVYGVAGYTHGGESLPGLQNDGYYYGIRRYPYSTDLARNPLLFQHIENGVPLPATPPPNGGGDNAQVHNTGEVWASMLWECYAGLLRDTGRLSFDQAQARMKRYLVAGYKLTPVAPTLVEARDALLAAISVESQEDLEICATGFAKRGAGQGAIAPDRYSLDNAGVVESYAVGAELVIDDVSLDMTAGAFCDTDGYLDNGETGQVVVQVRNSGSVPLDGVTVALASPSAGISFPGGAVAVLPTLAPYATTEVRRDIRLSNATAIGLATVYVDVNHPDLLVPGTVSSGIDEFTHVDVLPAARAFDDVEPVPHVWTVTAGGTPPFQWQREVVDFAEHAWIGPNVGYPGVTWLTSPPLQVGTTSNFTIEFLHRHLFESDAGDYYDGGVIELSTDGTNWVDVGTLAGGAYATGTLITYAGNGNPLAGRDAFVDANPSFPGLDAVSLDLGMAYAGQTVQVRFGVGTDNAIGAYGWELDNIAFDGLDNTPFPAFVPHANNCATSASTTVLTSSANPATANATVTFTASITGRTPGGTVDFTADNAPIAGCTGRTLTGSGGTRTATCATNLLAVGSRTIDADYSGDALNDPSSDDLAQTINAPTIVPGAADPAAGTFASAYNAMLTASGGKAPYAYALSAGALPAGVTLAANGTLSGTPTQVGPFAFTVSVQDASTAGVGGPFTASKSYTLTIGKRASTTVLTSDRAVVGSGAPLQLTATVTGSSPTGTVAFTDSAAPIAGCTAVAVNAGIATCTTSTLANGSRSLQAAYSGDALHNASNGALAQSVDGLPTIAAPASASTLEDQASAPLAITVGDAENAADALIVTATSSNQALVTNGALAAGLGGSGANRTLTITPAANANGTATITVTVRDAIGGTQTAAIALTVAAVNDAPTFALAGDRTHAGAAGGGLRTVPGFVTSASAGPGEASQVLTYAVTELSDSRGVVDGAAIASDGTLTYTLSGAIGTARLRVVAADDGGIADGGTDASAPREFAIVVASAGDVAVTVVRTGGSGAARTYEIRISNEASTAVEQVRLRTDALLGITGLTWTCTAPVGACTAANGSGSVDTAFDLPPAGVAVIELSVDVNLASPFVEIAAGAELPDDVVTLQAGDDRALYIEAAGLLGIMKNGFE